MKKKIQIRFVKVIDINSKTYLIQQKTWLGWKYIRSARAQNGVANSYMNPSKKRLLDTVIHEYFNVGRESLIIEEHPTVKLYC